MSVDKPCAEAVIETWKEMVGNATSRESYCSFVNLEDYLKYRIIDAGVPWVDALMRFGMGFVLTKEEEECVAPIAHLCYVAGTLANDLYSFDVECDMLQEERKTEKAATMMNVVWLYMQHENSSPSAAKERTRQVICDYEKRFLQEMHAFFEDEVVCTPRLRVYLTGISFFIPGNVVWSMSCSRYHPELCDKAETLLQSYAG